MISHKIQFSSGALSMAQPQFQRKRCERKSGFTLIELLMVIAVILILSSITFGIVRGVQNNQARARAKADLAVLANALEQFKALHGDYPVTTDQGTNVDTFTNEIRLFQSLDGWNVFTKDATTGQIDGMERRSNGERGRAFIEPARLILGSDSGGVYDPDVYPTTIYVEDPWGSAYRYIYGGNDGSWDNFGYVLYSLGADRDHNPIDRDGIVDQSIRDGANNLDNIYAGE